MVMGRGKVEQCCGRVVVRRDGWIGEGEAG